MDRGTGWLIALIVLTVMLATEIRKLRNHVDVLEHRVRMIELSR